MRLEEKLDTLLSTLATQRTAADTQAPQGGAVRAESNSNGSDADPAFTAPEFIAQAGSSVPGSHPTSNLTDNRSGETLWLYLPTQTLGIGLDGLTDESSEDDAEESLARFRDEALV